MRSKFENTKHLPDVFYKYEWNGSEVVKTKIRRIKVNHIEAFGYISKTTSDMKYISRPNNVELGVWDAQRKAVFLEKDDGELDALDVIHQHYVDAFGPISKKLTANILTQKAIRQYIRSHGGTIKYGEDVPV